LYQQSEGIRAMVEAFGEGPSARGKESKALETLNRIEEKLVSDQVKTGDILALLYANRKMVIGYTSAIDKSQAILSFLANGEAPFCEAIEEFIQV
jgi:hypothetical protein